MGQNEKQTGKWLPLLACGNIVEYENVSQTQRQPSQTAPKHGAGVGTCVCARSRARVYFCFWEILKNGMKHTPKKKGKENIVEKHIKRIKKWYMRERGMLKGAWDQGMWIKVLTWELQEVRSYSSISCSSNNSNWMSDEYCTSRGQEKIHQTIWN